jgi:hypothetical protein
MKVKQNFHEFRDNVVPFYPLEDGRKRSPVATKDGGKHRPIVACDEHLTTVASLNKSSRYGGSWSF